MSSPWPPPPSAAPGLACYRHPKVPAPVSCNRCDRPICTDCMVSAPVGWQCPTCLKGAPAVRRMRDVQVGAGGLADGTPYATYTIMATCVALFFGQQATDLTQRGVVVSTMVSQGELWRVITSGFLHGSLIHLLFNMLILFQLGTAVEARMGRARFLGLYFLSLVGGSIGALLLQPPTTGSLGASGAVFGLMGAVVVLGKRGRSPIESSVAGLLVLNLIITFLIPGISIGGHLGGLAAGMLGGLVIRAAGERADPRRLVLSALVLATMTLALFATAGPVAEWRCRSGSPAALSRDLSTGRPIDVEVIQALRDRASQLCS